MEQIGIRFIEAFLEKKRLLMGSVLCSYKPKPVLKNTKAVLYFTSAALSKQA